MSPKQRAWLAKKARRGPRRRSLFGFSGTTRFVTVWNGENIQRAIVVGTRSAPPPDLNLEEDAEATLRFLERIRGMASQPRTVQALQSGVRGQWVIPPRGGRRFPAIRNYFDYGGIKSISTSAALILTAEYARARELSGDVPPTIDLHEWDTGVFNTLLEIGFFEEVGLSAKAVEQYRERGCLKTIPIVSGTTAEELQEASEAILNLAPFIAAGGALPQELVVEMNTAIGEGLTNVSGWAYPDTHRYKYVPVKRWWLTAAADRDNATLTISLYDQGATIPVTFNRPSLPRTVWEFLTSKILPGRESPDDGSYIEGAMRFGASGTGLSHRGQGLPQMKELIDYCGGGSLTVLSRRGRCRYEPEVGMTSDSMGTSVGGTLVEWKMVLGGQNG